MSFEKRVLSSLNILALIGIPAMLIIVHLPHREGITDYSVIYMVLGGLALMFLAGNLLSAFPSTRGRIFENLPTFFMGTIIYAFIIAMAIYFTGGLESPFYYAALIGPLLAGVCFRLSLAMVSTTVTAVFYAIAIFLGARLTIENTQVIAFNLVYLYLACLFSSRLAQEMLRHEQAKDEATNLSNFIRKLEKAKTEFVSVVSHELRTPLTSIQGFSEFLLGREMTREKKREFYGIINNEAERLGRLITNLLNLSKIESGIELNKELIDLASILSEDIDLVQSQTDDHRIRMITKVRMPHVYADKDRVHQVIKNILSNAIKYSPDGGDIEVDLGLDGRFAWFSIADHGIGIPPEELPFIFERFRRVEKGEAATISGTGLGLAIVKLLVEMHGGRIVARSELKAGSTFTVYLPIRGE
jgi:signal transduction histidine kinase